jgi:L-2-hydroxycarboxylate dehydrogenase (NAD+)
MLATAPLEQRSARKEHGLVQADLLISAELRGHPSHGLQRLPRILARIERGLATLEQRGVGAGYRRRCSKLTENEVSGLWSPW